MFKIGDEVVCIDVSINNCRHLIELELYKKYIITNISFVDISMFVNINDVESEYYSERFKLLTEIRKEKLNRLLNV